jgi:hypothetical protein
MADSTPPSAGGRTGFTFLVIAVFAGGIAAGLAWLKHERAAVEAQPAATARANFPATGAAEARRELAAEIGVERELQALRTELAELRAAGARGEQPSHRETSPRVGHAAEASPGMGEATLAYWNRLNEIIVREAGMRAAPPKLTAGNALSFVTGQSDAYTYAAGAIRGLDPAGVDPQVLDLSRELALWYDQGAINSREAGSLLQSNDVAARQGRPGKTWKTSFEDHRRQCLEINQRGERLRGELSRKYGLAFPKLQ